MLGAAILAVPLGIVGLLAYAFAEKRRHVPLWFAAILAAVLFVGYVAGTGPVMDGLYHRDR